MRQRYYNPELKRFINQDILTGSIGNSASLNRYSYVEGNPVSYTDPFGLSPFSYISQPLHRTLDWAGMLPIVGVGFDWINAGIYLMEGKPTYALFAAFSSIGIGDGVKFLIKNGKKSIAGISITALFCETDAGSGLKEDIGVLVDDYATYQGYDQMSKDELALTLTIDLVLGAKSGYDDLNIKKKKVDVDVDDFVPDNATSRLDKIDGDDLVPDKSVNNNVDFIVGYNGAVVPSRIYNMSNDEFIQEVANISNRRINEELIAQGKKTTGHVAGTRKHKVAQDIVDYYQENIDDRGLLTEQNYYGGNKYKSNVKGSVRLDVYDTKTNQVYDYKYVINPGKGLSTSQINKIIKQGPVGLKKTDIHEINPN